MNCAWPQWPLHFTKHGLVPCDAHGSQHNEMLASLPAAGIVQRATFFLEKPQNQLVSQEICFAHMEQGGDKLVFFYRRLTITNIFLSTRRDSSQWSVFTLIMLKLLVFIRDSQRRYSSVITRSRCNR